MATLQLIKEAVGALHDRTGSSVIAINKYIEAEKKVAVKKHVMRATLKKAVETGILTMVKHSYKLSAEAAKKEKKKPVLKAIKAKHEVVVKEVKNHPKKTSTIKTASTGTTKSLPHKKATTTVKKTNMATASKAKKTKKTLAIVHKKGVITTAVAKKAKTTKTTKAAAGAAKKKTSAAAIRTTKKTNIKAVVKVKQ